MVMKTGFGYAMEEILRYNIHTSDFKKLLKMTFAYFPHDLKNLRT